MPQQTFAIISPPKEITIKDAVKLHGLEWLRSRPVAHGPYDVYINDEDLNAAIELWADEPENAFRNKRFYGSIIKNDPHHCCWIYSSQLVTVQGIDITSAASYKEADAYLCKMLASLSESEKKIITDRVFTRGHYGSDLGIFAETLNESFPGQTMTVYHSSGIYSSAIIMLENICDEVIKFKPVSLTST
jgi:hypothetical protein